MQTLVETQIGAKIKLGHIHMNATNAMSRNIYVGFANKHPFTNNLILLQHQTPKNNEAAYTAPEWPKKKDIYLRITNKMSCTILACICVRHCNRYLFSACRLPAALPHVSAICQRTTNQDGEGTTKNTLTAFDRKHVL